METKRHTYRDALQNRLEQVDELYMYIGSMFGLTEEDLIRDYKAVIDDLNLALGTRYTEESARAWSCAKLRDNGAKARPNEVVQSIRSGFEDPNREYLDDDDKRMFNGCYLWSFGGGDTQINSIMSCNLLTQHCAGIQDGETYYHFEVWPNDPHNRA